MRKWSPSPFLGGADSASSHRRPMALPERGHLVVYFVATLGAPLVLAHADGLTCIGMHFSEKPARGVALKAALRIAQEIMLHCRWASEESLKLYRRIGDSKAIHLCDKAEKAVVDRVDMTSIPIVDESQGFAALQAQYAEANVHDRTELLADAASHEWSPSHKRKRTELGDKIDIVEHDVIPEGEVPAETVM